MDAVADRVRLANRLPVARLIHRSPTRHHRRRALGQGEVLVHELIAIAVSRFGQQLKAGAAQEHKARKDRQGGGRRHETRKALGEALERDPRADDHQGDHAHAGEQGAEAGHRQLVDGDVELHQIAG